MTVGEKIQTYRKQLGMSQEELGQKLLVSRQTISLWEKDQTVPTIDNLIRLREILGVSVDEILGFENIEKKDEILLCIYGSFFFISANVYDHSDEQIVRAEQTTGIDIPEHKQISTQDWTKGTQSVSRGYIYYTSDIYFENSAVANFEKQLAKDDKWLSSVSNDLIGITSPMNDYGIYDFVLVYNVDTCEYNTLPNRNGKYRFINILYRLEENQMKIVEYDIEYVK